MKNNLLVLITFFGFIQSAHAISNENRAAIFDSIYKNGVWGIQETRSGYGSRMEATRTVRNILPRLIDVLKVKTLLDLPCGDFNWMKAVDLGDCHYLGADIVEDVVNNNKATHTTKQRSFEILDAVKDALPKVDLILCRDLIAHLKFTDAQAMIANFKKSGATYVLMTTYAKCPVNAEDPKFPTGEWHPVNLTLPPFNLCQPFMIFEEAAPMSLDTHFGKSLGLWRLEDIK